MTVVSRPVFIGTYVSRSEHADLVRAARDEGLSLSGLLRRTALKAAKRQAERRMAQRVTVAATMLDEVSA